MKNLINAIILLLLLIQPGFGKHTAPNFIVINEVKTVGSDNHLDEFIELLNVSDSLFNIGGYSLIYFRSNGLPYGDSLSYLADGKLYPVLYTFPHPTYMKPYHYFLIATVHCSEAKAPDAIMGGNLLSNGQLILVDSTLSDTLDAVAWGTIQKLVTNEGLPARYLEPIPGPPVSPDLLKSPHWSLHRNPEGNDTNNNFADFEMRNFTTPMNSSDSLKLILTNSFQGEIDKESILLRWKTLSITKDLQFLIYQKASGDSNWNIIDPGFALKVDTKKDTNQYYFVYENPKPNLSYQFKVREIDFRQHARFSETVTVNFDEKAAREIKPQLFTLAQNYPNPFRSETDIFFKIYEENWISLVIYNLSGQKIRTLAQGVKQSGHHEIKWDGADAFGNKVPSGVYFCVLHYGNNLQRPIKMLVLR